MKPGETTKPRASITERPLRLRVVTALISPFEMPRLRMASERDSGSITRPLRMTRSKAACEPADKLALISMAISKIGPIGPIGPITLTERFTALYLDLQRAKLPPPAHLSRHKSHRAYSPSCKRDLE